MPCYISTHFASILKGKFKKEGISYTIGQNGSLVITIDTKVYGNLIIYTDEKNVTYLQRHADAFWVSNKVSESYYEVSHIIQHGADIEPGRYYSDTPISHIFSDVTDYDTIDIYIN